MARRNDHSRDEIHRMALDAAERIVAREGYKGLSARKVAAAIDYTVGTLYLVFENLDDLVLQVNGRTLDALFARLLKSHAQSGDTARDLQSLADAYIAYAEKEAPRWTMLFDSVTEKGESLPDWYQDKLGLVFGLIETALVPAAPTRNRTEIAQAARVLWAGVHGICILKIRQRMDLAGGQSASQMAAMLIGNFLVGFRGSNA
jgi:AcrR family transcriptional regulator